MELPSATIVLPVALALTGAGLSGAVLTGTLPLPAEPRAAADPPVGWEVVETFSGKVGADITQGTLDLRIFRGNVRVVGWEQSSYEVSVLRAASGGQRAGDKGIRAEFQEQPGEVLGLSLVVKPTGAVGISLDGSDRYAVLASVPASLDWQQVLLCSGLEHELEKLLAPVLAALGEEDEELGCVEAPGPGVDASIGLSLQEESAADEVPFGVEGLRGGELTVIAQYADLGFLDAAFASASVLTHYGDVQGALDAAKLALATHYGDVALATRVDELAAVTHYGDLHVLVTGGGSGKLDLMSHYGDVALGVPAGQDRGYDATGKSEYGEVVIELSGAEEAGDEGDGARAARRQAAFPDVPFPLPGQPSSPEEKGRDAKHVKTANFDGAPVQVTIRAVSHYGDVLVTDGQLPPPEDEGH